MRRYKTDRGDAYVQAKLCGPWCTVPRVQEGKLRGVYEHGCECVMTGEGDKTENCKFGQSMIGIGEQLRPLEHYGLSGLYR